MTKTASSDQTAKKILPWLVAVSFFMEALDTTILNTAVPIIANAMGVVPLSMKSVLSSYTLSLAVFIPVSSWAADRYGTRRVFSFAIAMFTLGSLLCGLANDIRLLVFFRILQGFGGAMMVPVGRLTMVRTFPKSELLRAMSFVAIPGLVGPMLGPVIGGFFVGYFHWRAIFFVNIPIGLLGLYLVYRFLPDYRAKKASRLDVVGFVLFGSGISLLSYVVEVFGEHTLGTIEILGLLAIALVSLFGYFVHAKRVRFPLLRLGLLVRIRTLRAAVSGSFLTRLGAGGMPFLLPLLYQLGLGFSPLQSGLLVMPQPLAAICFKFFMPSILTRFGYRQVLIANTIAMGATIGLFSTIAIGTPIWMIVLQSSLFGIFSSLQYTSMNTLAYADVAEPDASMASTIVSTMQQLSISFGIAVGSIATSYFIPDRSHAASALIISGLHKAFLVLGGLTILSSFIFATLKNDDGDNMSQHGPRSV